MQESYYRKQCIFLVSLNRGILNRKIRNFIFTALRIGIGGKNPSSVFSFSCATTTGAAVCGLISFPLRSRLPRENFPLVGAGSLNEKRYSVRKGLNAADPFTPCPGLCLVRIYGFIKYFALDFFVSPF